MTKQEIKELMEAGAIPHVFFKGKKLPADPDVIKHLDIQCGQSLDENEFLNLMLLTKLGSQVLNEILELFPKDKHTIH